MLTVLRTSPVSTINLRYFFSSKHVKSIIRQTTEEKKTMWLNNNQCWRIVHNTSHVIFEKAVYMLMLILRIEDIFKSFYTLVFEVQFYICLNKLNQSYLFY